MSTQTVTTDLEQMDGADIAGITSTQSVRRRYQLPAVVASGKSGTQINTLELLLFLNTGAGWCELFSFETQRVCFLIPPYSRNLIRPIFAGLLGEPEWQWASNKETIIALGEQATEANITSTAVTAEAAELALSTSGGNTYAAAGTISGWDADIDAVIAGAELDFDASAAESEVYIAAILDKMETLHISASA